MRRKSFIPWVGGKRCLAQTIVQLLPEHESYVEVFGGAGWVLFRKDPAKHEVYNDLDGRLIELFRSVKEHPEEMARQLEMLVPSREMFEDFRDQPGLTEIQRAARFFYVLRLSFGAKAASFGAGTRLALARVRADMEAARERLERVCIEHMDFAEVLLRYDKPGALFFVDPPYYGREGVYEVPFTHKDHERLRALLESVQSRWVLTYGDHPWVRTAYVAYPCWTVDSPYTLPHGPADAGHQLIITNYRPTAAQLRAAPRPLTKLRALRRRRKKDVS